MQTSTAHILEQICQGQHLNKTQAFDYFRSLMQGHLSHLEMAALLTALKSKGEHPHEIEGALLAFMEGSTPFPDKEYLKKNYLVVDCCGTGGDGKNTLNISTAVALVLSCFGLKIAKHGNRAVSSQCGSADLLEKLGVKIEISPSLAKRSLEEMGMCFLYAPLYHPGTKHLSQVRSTLKIKTLLNLLGPLLNPLQPDYQLIGLYSPNYCLTLANVLKARKTKRALIIHGDGLDELALHGPTTGALLNDGDIIDFTFTPEQAGLKRYPLCAITGQDIEYNTKACIDLLSGNGTQAYRAMVALNAGALLWLVEKACSIKVGVEMVQSILDTDLALSKLHQLIEVSHAT
jgi:anthranilate phosphoribosyltransferase